MGTNRERGHTQTHGVRIHTERGDSWSEDTDGDGTYTEMRYTRRRDKHGKETLTDK